MIYNKDIIAECLISIYLHSKKGRRAYRTPY
jgi:hypothetical protein